MATKKLNVTAAALRRASDSRSYKKGEDYFHRGLVRSLLADGDEIVAKVSGTRNYKIRLRMEDGEVDGECSCPMGDMGSFCKHMVAVGLAHLAGGVVSMPKDGTKATRRTKCLPKPKVTLDDVREHLLAKDPADLVEIIMQQVLEDDRLRESLLMKVARQRPGSLDVATFRAAIDTATDSDGFIDYREAYGFTSGVDSVVVSIAELLKSGHAVEVIELTEHALRRCEHALGHMDDSDGGMSPILERLQELHHTACLKAKPDPETLAKRLFKWEVEDQFDTFYHAAETYADVLGEKGLAVYSRLAQKLWEQMPQLRPSDKREYDGPRYRITSIMESLAKATGDVEQLVAAPSGRSGPTPAPCRQARPPCRSGRYRDSAFADQHPDSRLEDFLADEKHADRAKEWPQWRNKALTAIRESIDKRKKVSAAPPKDPWRSRSWDRPVDHSVLVDIFLWEGDPEVAWQEAQAGGCNDALWMRLAGLREKDHPADALAIYQRQIDPIVAGKNNDAYREAARLIRKIRQLMARIGREADFGPYLDSVRKAHKPKRNFMAMLADL